MDPLVPLLIPEVKCRSPQPHSRAAQKRMERRHRHQPQLLHHRPRPGAGAVTVFDLRQRYLSTMQAVSGAGYPGVPSLDILGNVVPFISGEEER